MERELLLTHRARFSASHFYYVPDWSAEKNREVFGKAANQKGHGHNYVVDVTLRGAVNPETGMVINIGELKEIVAQALEELDHKNLNLEVPPFARCLPTPENLSLHIWDSVSERLPVGKLESVRVFEDESTSAEYRGTVSVVRTYHFSAAHRLFMKNKSEDENRALYGNCSNPEGHGHNYTLEITVEGKPESKTGSLVNIEELDRLLYERILKPWDHRNLDREIVEFRDHVSTGENIAVETWNRLADTLSQVELVSVKVGETPNAFFEYRGEARP